MSDIAQHPDDFANAFESALAGLQIRMETACAAEVEWPAQVAAGIRAALAFAAAHPEAANRLTNGALAHGADGLALYERLIAYFIERLEAGREQRLENAGLPDITERSVAGGIAMLVAYRLDTGRADELPALAPEAIQFALTPYLGTEKARLLATGG